MRSWVALCIGLGLAACTGPASQNSPRTPLPEVIATSAPCFDLARKLSDGQPWRVALLPPSDASPHTWRPNPEEVGRTQRAALVIVNGAGLETWLTTVALPHSRLIECSEKSHSVAQAGSLHQHGTDGAHSHGEVDPMTWLDPSGRAHQAEVVADGLATLPEANTEKIHATLNTIQHEMELLRGEFATALERERVQVASAGPQVGHLARALGVEIPTFLQEPMQPPSDAFVQQVTSWSRGSAASVLLWSSYPEPAVLSALPAHIRHVVLDPIDRLNEHGELDYASRMRAMLRALAAGHQDPRTP